MKTKFYRNCSRRRCDSSCSRYVQCKRAYRLRMIARLVSPLFNALTFIFKGSRRTKVAISAFSMVFIAVLLAITGTFDTNTPSIAYAASDSMIPADLPVATTAVINSSLSSSINGAYEINDMGAYSEDADLVEDDLWEPIPEEVQVEVNIEEVEQPASVTAEVEQEPEPEPAQVVITDEMMSEMAANLGAPGDYNAPVAMAGMLYLVNNEGFSVSGAAGLIGNAYSESRFNPGADNGSHFGVFQWDYYDRWPKISEYLESIGCSHTSRYDSYSGIDIETQKTIFVCHLEASLHSSDASYYQNTIEFCKTTSSASDSADRWRANYEVCGAAVSERMTVAEVTANLYFALFG